MNLNQARARARYSEIRRKSGLPKAAFDTLVDKQREILRLGCEPECWVRAAESFMNEQHEEKLAKSRAVGVVESRPLSWEGHPERAFKVGWEDPRLARITRLRLISDRGFPFWDVSYAMGVLYDGTNVDVDIGIDQLAKSAPGGRGIQNALISAANRDGVSLNKLQVWAAISCLQ